MPIFPHRNPPPPPEPQTFCRVTKDAFGRVKKFFEAHGLVYDVRPYFSCLRQTLANLHAVGHSTKDD